MTEPLTPPDCDLRGLPFMPLDVVRLTDSDLFALSTGDEFKAAITVWCKSWLQIPAASLPDDDRILAHLSGAGARWRKVRDTALRGFVKCSDGRLYHPVIAEKANDAWERRGEWQEKQNNKNERQKRWRDHIKAASEELRALGVVPPMNASATELDRLLVDARLSTSASTSASTPSSTVDEGETALTGTGTGTVVPLDKGSNGGNSQSDPEAVFWRDAKAWLRPKVKGDPGALLNKWMREHGKEMTRAALSAAQVENAVDPPAYVAGYFRRNASATEPIWDGLA